MRILLLLVLSSAIAACGGGSSGSAGNCYIYDPIFGTCLSSGGGDTTPPRITTFSPPDNATYIDQDATVNVTFNEVIDPSSVTGTSFVLRDQNSRQVSGQIQYAIHFSNTDIKFVPDVRLQDSTQYNVLVGTGIKDSAGNHLSNATTWTFTTAPGGIGSWVTTSLTGAPAARVGHTAIWTGTEMIVWGGNYSNSTGYRYNPMTDTWSAISTQGAPSSRSGHTAIWTGTEMIIWGGTSSNYNWLDDGARYNPVTDTWQSISLQGAPSARGSHSAVWTGSEMLIWGGRSGGYFPTYPPEGGRYNTVSDTWQSMSTANVPTDRTSQEAVWTGTEMIVWGGSDGGRYDPNTDSWMSVSSQNAPIPRGGHSIVWTGNEMIVWGGYDGQQYLDSGGKYNPVTDSWVPTSQSNAPLPRSDHSAVWTGAKMIVWGGYYRTRLGGQYDPVNDTWFYTTSLDSPVGRSYHTAIWTGSQMVIWGGSDGLGALGDGGLYTP
jgi:N-acetylneuraminic acid mutarotase